MSPAEMVARDGGMVGVRAGDRRGVAARIVRAGLAALCVLMAGLLAWEFVGGALAWSNGWMEGASYGLGAVLFLAIAALLVAGRTRDPRLYLSTALVLAIPAAWCVRWTVWLLTAAREIGPAPFFAPLLPAAAAVLLFAGAALLVRRAVRAQ